MSMPVADSTAAVELPAECAASTLVSPRPLSLRKNFAWTLAGNVVYAGCQWGTLMVLAKYGAPEHLGQLALGMAIANPVFSLLNLHLRPGYVADSSNEFKFTQYLTLRLLTLPVAIAAVFCIGAMLARDGSTRMVIGAVSLVTGVQSLADMLFAAPHRAERMSTIGIALALRGIASLAIIGVLLLTTSNLALALVGASAMLLVLVVVRDVPQAATYASIRPDWTAPPLAALAFQMLPLSIGATLLALAVNIPAYALVKTSGVELLGFYAVIASVLKVGDTVNSALMESAVARLAALHASLSPQLWSLLLRIAAFVALLNALGVAAALLLGHPFLTYAYTRAHGTYHFELVLISVVGLVSSLATVLSRTLTAMRHFRLQFAINAAIVLSGASIASVLIPRWQVAGAVLTLLSIHCLRCILCGAVLIIVPARRARASRNDGNHTQPILL